MRAAWIWILLGLAVPACAGNAGSLEVKGDGTARLVGVVLENDRGCEVDAICRLIVDAGGKRAFVVYHGGEAVRCVNREAVRQGFAVKAGDRVEAYGDYEVSGPTVSTCGSERYYIRPSG
ncbi:MAG TPA: hypothetical protein VEG34_17535 [Thermoanaerobaculia bacterium]|nr:hypothetical protein [Thermoanaerobaculia bacterium]